MDNQYSENQSGDNSQGAPANAASKADLPHAGILGPDGNPIPKTQEPETPQQTYKKIADAEKRISKWVVIWAGITALATVAQVAIAVYSSRTASRVQTDQFNQMKSVADRIEGAAKSFAGNSANISQGIGEAVAQLGIQAGASKDIAIAAKTSAEIASTALQPIVADSVSTLEVKADSVKFQLNARNEGGSIAIVTIRYCAFTGALGRPKIISDCTPKNLHTVGPVPVLPHNSYPVQVSLASSADTKMEDVISGKIYLYIPVSTEYLVKGKSRFVDDCFTYEKFFNTIGSCQDIAP